MAVGRCHGARRPRHLCGLPRWIEVDIDISPICMSLVGVIEFLVAIAGVAAGCGSFAVAWIIRQVNNRQHQIQINSASASLALRMREDWSVSRNPQFAKFIGLFHDSKVKAGDDRIRQLLNIMETIAVFWKEGTITEKHVRELFGTDLRDIRKNKPVYDQLKEKYEEGRYANLWKLVKKSEKW